MSVITLDQMQSTLVSLSDMEALLATTEPLSTQEISSNTRVRFRLQPGWEADLDAIDDSDSVNAFITIGGRESQMTKEAALQATSTIGVPQALVRKSPGALIEPLLNHFWGAGLGNEEHKALLVGDKVAAFTKASLTPFSNLELLERVEASVKARYGTGATIMADYKYSHTLQGTNVRLILPDVTQTMADTGMNDTPSGSEDRWFGGLHLRNSLVGKGQTSIEPYLFRWWCTNGCTTERSAGMAWSRQGSDGQNLEEVYSWAQRAVDEVLGGMEEEFESVRALTRLGVGGNTADVLGDIFQRYSLPVSQRDSIRMNIENHDGPLTLYTVMNAITSVANEPGMGDSRSDRLMRIGGAIPSTEFDPLKARIFREGQSNPGARNPYEIHSIN